VPQSSGAVDPIACVLFYHLQTKHDLDRYARSLGHLDWASQPDPFRTFLGPFRWNGPGRRTA
jgi:hypothetical protein